MRRIPALTIIELLIVITIMGILFALAGVSIGKALSNGRDASRIGDVLLISKSLDQAAVVTRGVYPKNATGGQSDSGMCADQMALTTLDLSLFKTHSIPQDPAPLSPLGKGTPCASAQNGYFYATEYGQAAGIHNTAIDQKVNYTLEADLENTVEASNNLKRPSELSDYSGLNVQPLSNTYSNPVGRIRYLVNGPYCGGNCYN